AIRQRPAGLAPAEMKLRIAGIADRPVAHRFFQREDARPLRKWDDKLLKRRGLGVELSLVLRFERDVAARAEQQRRRAVLALHMCPGLVLGLAARDLAARPDRPSRCTLPITAFLVTPPKRPAI